MKKPNCKACFTDLKYCNICVEMEKYEAFRESKRKYAKGEAITSIDEYALQEFVWIYGGVKHIGFACSQSARTVLYLIKCGSVFYAVKK